MRSCRSTCAIPEASVPRPDKELRGFDKVYLEPGETKTVSIALDARAFAFWDPRLRTWIVEPGLFEILIGSSAADIRERMTVPAVHARPAHIHAQRDVAAARLAHE